MDKFKLKMEFELGFKKIPTIYDKVGMTSGVGHGRFVRGQKLHFKSKEEFFKEIMLKPESPEGSIGTNTPWNKRTNFIEWIEGLQIQKSSQNEITNWINDTIKEVQENYHHWKDQYPIDFKQMKISKNHNSVIKIKETVHPRFYINTYTGFISEDKNDYFFLEEQFES